MSSYKDPTIMVRTREAGEPNGYFKERPLSCPNCKEENAWMQVFYATTDSLTVWQCTNCKYNAGVVK